MSRKRMNHRALPGSASRIKNAPRPPPILSLIHIYGQVIKISPTSANYINPMDLNLDYSADESPLSLKSDFILSLCELIVGGKEGLQPCLLYTSRCV